VLEIAEGAALAAARLKTSLLAVVGPTASGKTDLALELARRLGGEILSADMGQLYKLLDAGTAKPVGKMSALPDGREVNLVEGIPYHLTDVLDPSESTDAGRYAQLARPVLEDLLRRGKTAIVCGGTGFYVRALIEGLPPLPKSDESVRARLRARAQAEGAAALHEELLRKDPQAADRIPASNLQRVLRALEVLESTGRTFSSFRDEKPSQKMEASYIGIEHSAAELRERIRLRAADMFPRMISEVRALVPSRFRGDEPGFRCLGYPEALACAQGRLSQEEGLARMVQTSAAYAKRQRTWFRHQANVRWIEPKSLPDFLENYR
jgi:tRNA dimethylallyltransferase